MAQNRIAFRARLGRNRANTDENAINNKLKTSSTVSQATRPVSKDYDAPTGKAAVTGTAGTRAALGEVNQVNVPRKTVALKNGKSNAQTTETLKRPRSTSVANLVGPTKAAPGPTRTANATQAPAIAPTSRPVSTSSIQSRTTARLPQRASGVPAAALAVPVVAPVVVPEPQMDVEDESAVLVELDDVEEYAPPSDVDIVVEEEPTVKTGLKRSWPDMDTGRRTRCRREVQAIREVFTDEIDMFDPTLVAEYAEEIFEYMEELEVDMMPSADYISGQTEITWEMRETLVDWLLQVHLRYHMLPETLWIAVNLVDRFLSRRVVSVAKLQLVGVTAMLVAAKYEEILAPSVDEFVFLCEGGYTREEILKGEGIVLQTLEFRISQYCSPYSWMRRISKADDYDIQTRTLSKFLTELTLLDHRFLAVKPSLVAAVGMYSARRMLGGAWTEPFIYHSGCTEEQVREGHQKLVEKLCEPGIEKTSVCKKYAHKKFLKASLFALEWARTNVDAELDQLEDADAGESCPPSDGAMLTE